MDVIAVQLTTPTPGAIGVILLRGRNAPQVLQAVTRSTRAGTLTPGEVARVEIVSAAGAPIDDALLVCLSPERYELHIHGGTAVVDAVLARLSEAGARVLPLEQAQGVLGPGLDAEVLLALPKAVTSTALRLLLDQPAAWRAWVQRWEHRLAETNAGGTLWQLQTGTQWILTRSTPLRRLLEPARVAIVGPPNAGKSTLANALLGRPVSITSAQAGTTRDWVDAQAVFATPNAYGGPDVHVPVILIDTAGIRETPDPLEQASIARTHRQAADADVIIYLIDAASGASVDANLASLAHRPLVLACNKCDLPGAKIPSALAAFDPVRLSAKTHAGLDVLMTAVIEQLDLQAMEREPFAFSARREELLAELSLCNDPARCRELLHDLGR